MGSSPITGTKILFFYLYIYREWNISLYEDKNNFERRFKMIIYANSAREICRIFNLENVEITAMENIRGIYNEPLVKITYRYKEEA